MLIICVISMILNLVRAFDGYDCESVIMFVRNVIMSLIIIIICEGCDCTSINNTCIRCACESSNNI